MKCQKVLGSFLLDESAFQTSETWILNEINVSLPQIWHDSFTFGGLETKI